MKVADLNPDRFVERKPIQIGLDRRLVIWWNRLKKSYSKKLGQMRVSCLKQAQEVLPTIKVRVILIVGKDYSQWSSSQAQLLLFIGGIAPVYRRDNGAK